MLNSDVAVTHRLSIECLTLAQAFETYWAYYQQSGGQLFDDDCRTALRRFCESLEELALHDPKVLDPVELSIGEKTDVEDIVLRMKQWAAGDHQYPYERVFQSRFMMFALLSGLKILLIRKLKLNRCPPISMTTRESEHSEHYLRWKGHLPHECLKNDPAKLIDRASSSPTIVVVGDIRRSQDLMTHSVDPAEYSERMVQFIERTRHFLKLHGGFFDKFTGDGFIAYFNEDICNAIGKDFVTAFLSFLRDVTAFCTDHFRQWSRIIRKLPSVEIGLAIGADLGRVIFQDVQHHLIAVGQPLVWASRMASVALANEIIVNNLLAVKLSNADSVDLTNRLGETKTGESFLAKVMTFKQQVDMPLCSKPPTL